MRRRFSGILALSACAVLSAGATLPTNLMATPAEAAFPEEAFGREAEVRGFEAREVEAGEAEREAEAREASAREAYAAFNVPVTLRGSLRAMRRQHSVTLALGFPFADSRREMDTLVMADELVRLEGNADYGFRNGVDHLVARPETRVFVERLAKGYRNSCGQRLVVTSATRPLDRQPSNAHRLSVHPAGVAVDLRVSDRLACRSWLESNLLDMERQGVLDVTREYYPPHYHVALFPDAYMEAVAPLLEAEEAERLAAARAARLQAEREL
ncbi:MAG TPA: DUF5715 family protein, partial [Longimicrobiales bacterium]|nr:DUF5715 family protein [Longimicrobiales bacterium]